MNRALLVGSIGAGKSTLTHALLGSGVKAVKTQTLTYYDWIVDTPGEYTENPLFYKNIMATSLEVTHIIYLQDATNRKKIFPPGFSLGIPKHPIGVITKADADGADILQAIAQLKQVISKGPIIVSSAFTGKGLEEIRKLVTLNSVEEMKEYTLSRSSEDVIYYETLYN
ncbi:EutP/PduV family microcompartment system protein [Cytobacillus sp. S13-E01]|uniref:EutP/PduV family microcompartment system protein n=1 Tax=Cytobacillus sp. S13-E01 TaxID=3031326 RepID=UPI0023D8B010|nr:EutP/PduV family microcompartment system protein [Cytobacillus sp. S13-E01]MDF0725989.1 EutP/PduV family microcompartment system protein [Cytobacillus sp. S13-E01]